MGIAGDWLFFEVPLTLRLGLHLAMFNSILYRGSNPPGLIIDAGAIAESLIFYGRVKITGNSAILNALVKSVPPFELLSLMRAGKIEFFYLGDQVGVATRENGKGQPVHSLVGFSSPQHTIEKTASQSFLSVAGSSSAGIIGASEFESLVKPIDHAAFDQKSIETVLHNANRANRLATAFIESVIPAYASLRHDSFSLIQDSQGMLVHTSIDFELLNKFYHEQVSPEQDTITAASIIAAIQDAYETAYLAGTLDSEVFLGDTQKAVLSETISAIVEISQSSEQQLEKFNELTLGNGHAIREAVNSGEVRFSEVVSLLEKADNFKSWLHSQTPETSLIAEFYANSTRDTWVEKIPTKTMRFAVFTGLGLVADAFLTGGLGALTGMVLGATDSFLLDKLVGGWKPHQFIDHSLKGTSKIAKWT
jgi:hypothetical protein